MRAHLLRYTLQHWDIGTSNPDKWVMGQQDGVFLLAIKEPDFLGDEVEHTAVIEAGAQIIIDSCEPNALQMTW